MAVSEKKGKYRYDNKVVCEIEEQNLDSYYEAADFINDSDVEAIVLEHEYGIYGGEDGEYILGFLERVNKPVITSFHSVLDEKKTNPKRHSLTQKIIDLSDTIILMTHGAKVIFLRNFEVAKERIAIVAHGVPNVRFDEKEKIKKRFGFEEKTVISTFGLINRGKGIELAIEAISRLKNKFPNLTYLVIGATHPAILRREKEAYRQELLGRVEELGLKDNVIFVNKYLSYEELVDHLLATDIYLAPQLDLVQSFSGTISYAMGCGAVVVSSPTKYAKEVLANRRGILAMPKASKIAFALNRVLSSEKIMRKYQLDAYNYARDMIWPKVSLNYLSVVESSLFNRRDKWYRRLPDFSEKPRLDHFLKMTDSFGIVQHTRLHQPDYEFGYSIDDQARALIVALRHAEVYGGDEQFARLIDIYLNYLQKAVDQRGKVHNFIRHTFDYADLQGSSDSIARGLWALGYLISSRIATSDQKNTASKLLPAFEKNDYSHIKTIAYALLGYYYLRDEEKTNSLAEMLLLRFKDTDKAYNGEWVWYESALTYANPILPYAMIKAYRLCGEKRFLSVALKTLSFLETVYYDKGTPAPVGQSGWYTVGGGKATFDQQPLEAGDMVLLYNELYEITKKRRFKDKAREWMGWYFGNNTRGVNMYDNATGGIYDGITLDGVNRNQGAESIVTYLLAYLSFNGGI